MTHLRDALCVLAGAVLGVWLLGWLQRRAEDLAADAKLTAPQVVTPVVAPWRGPGPRITMRTMPRAIDLGEHRHDGTGWGRP